MPEDSPPVLDTMILHGFVFGLEDGLDVLLTGLGVPSARLPAEVYNRDEESLPLSDGDEALMSEFAIGMRYAKRKAMTLAAREAARYETWLANAKAQLPRFLERGSLIIDTLEVEELAQRILLENEYGIGRGEAACLIIAKRGGARFISSDEEACKAATALGVPYCTILDVLEGWVTQSKPNAEAIDRVINGLRDAKFALTTDQIESLQTLSPNQNDQ